MRPRRAVGQPLPVPADQTLARARGELAAGETARARERLHGLLATYPHRLDVRSALAETQRADGDRIQAGRWGYLLPDSDPAETAAFLEAYPAPVARVRAMRWSGPEDASGPAVQALLLGLRTAAETDTGGPVSWTTARPRPTPPPSTLADALVPAGCFVVVAVLAALVVIGAVTVVGWLR